LLSKVNNPVSGLLTGFGVVVGGTVVTGGVVVTGVVVGIVVAVVVVVAIVVDVGVVPGPCPSAQTIFAPVNGFQVILPYSKVVYVPVGPPLSSVVAKPSSGTHTFAVCPAAECAPVASEYHTRSPVDLLKS
jgi:hypothetical protein